MLSKRKRCGEIDGEANQKRVKSGKVSSLHYWKFWWVEIRALSLVYKLNVRMCSLFQYSEFGLKYIIFLRCRFSDLKAAYLNIRRSEGGIRKSLGFTLEEISIPQTWTRKCVAPGHNIFSRREKMDFNSQRLTLELSVNLSQSFQASYTIGSHGSVIDLESVLINSDGTTPAFPGQIPCLLQRLENLPICLGFSLEKGEAVVTLSPYTTGQFQDLADCSKEPETRVFSDLCLVVCKSGATS